MRKYANLYQIGEVAQFYGISRKMILNYEKQGLIKPSFIDDISGYRYFNFVAISKVGLILDLRRAGMSIADIGLYLKGKISVDKQIELLKEQIKSIQHSIEQLEIRRIDGKTVSEVTDTIIPVTHCLCKNCVAANIDEAMKEFFEFYQNCFKKNYFTKDNLLICEYTNDIFANDFFETENISIRYCVSVNPQVCKEELFVFPKTHALSVTYCGEMEDSFVAYDKLKQYVIDNKLTVCGYPREYYLEGDPYGNDTKIIQIIVPIN